MIIKKRFLIASLAAISTVATGSDTSTQTLSMEIKGATRLVIEVFGDIDVVHSQEDAVKVTVESTPSVIYWSKGKEVRKYNTELLRSGDDLKLRPDAETKKTMTGLVLGGKRHHIIRVPETLQVVLSRNGKETPFKSQ